VSFRQNGVGPEKNCADAILLKGHDLVVTWTQVLDRKDGKIVKGLEIDDFVLREDGKPQLLIKLAGLICSGQASPGISGIGRKSSPLH